MANYIKDADIYALFQESGADSLHISDIDKLPRVSGSIYYVHDRWIDQIEHSFFLSKDYDKVGNALIERGKKRYEERYNSAKKELEDHEQELEMLKGLLKNANDFDYVKNNYNKIKGRIEELPNRIKHYEHEVKTLERSLRNYGYIYFSGYSIEPIKIEDVVNQDIKKFSDC